MTRFLIVALLPPLLFACEAIGRLDVEEPEVGADRGSSDTTVDAGTHDAAAPSGPDAEPSDSGPDPDPVADVGVAEVAPDTPAAADAAPAPTPDTSPDLGADDVGAADAPVDVEPEHPPWVQLLSPAAGEVENPVEFAFLAGAGVIDVILEADGWALHDGALSVEAGRHTYEFSGVGFERHVVLRGYDSDGVEVATDDVWITVRDTSPDLVFPIDLDAPGLFLSHFDSPSSSASFGAGRAGGRLHAGCDVYWTNDNGLDYRDGYYVHNDDRGVFAVADGTVVAYSAFYLGTHSVVVDHGDFVVRYGEVDDRGLVGGLGVGSPVTAGQRIATMGDLNIGSTWSMLHFELYAGSTAGSLTQSGNYAYDHVASGNYQRRRDLMDCEPFLLELLAAAGR